jgi:hypothetical protein
MAFIRYTTVEDKRYYQVVRSYREGGKPRQKVLCHLGVHDSLERAIEHEKRKEAAQRSAAAALRKKAKQIYDAGAAGSRPFSEAYINARQEEWRGEETNNDSYYDARYLRQKRWIQGYFTEWKPAMDFQDFLLILELIRRKENLGKSHRAKLNKLTEIQQRYGDLKYKGTGSNLDRPD